MKDRKPSLFIYLSPSNYKYVKKIGKTKATTYSAYVERLIERDRHASDARKARASSS